jgi:glycolate oxidase iron-sulfur subunit
MDPWFGPVHEATITLLRRAGFRVIAPKDQTCCGAMAAHEGAAAEAKQLAVRNVAAFAGVDIVVSDAAGCSAHLKEYVHWVDGGGSEFAAKARDVTEVVAEAITAGRLPRLPGNGREVAVQDPCHLRHAQRITDPPRLILEAAGFQVVEIDPDGLCCGAGGAWSLFWPAESAELGDLKAAQIQSTGLQLVASANPGCEIQIRAHLPHAVRIAHPIELYAEALAAAEPRREA